MSGQFIKTCLEDKDIKKSAEDKRIYRALELNNGMRVLVVSDKETDKASAAMDVHVGHMSDPWEIPGLAHFCEHMLFLGTEKYPEENHYSKFLNEHGGRSNAFTTAEHTNFYFDVSSEHLSGALDRFAQFFLCPLFTASATEREVNAVNSENDKNLQNDTWRVYQLMKSLADPKHDFSKFGTGNKYTLQEKSKELGLDVRNELLKFHEKMYSSNLMGLSVLGKESVEELTDLIVPLFANVKNKVVPIPEWNDDPYGLNYAKNIAYVVPVKDIRNLGLSWSIPDLHPYYKADPGHLIGHLIGHEGPGSLLSELKARGWVNTLVGGEKHGAKGFSFFTVNVDLTEQGIDHVNDIITLTYQYLNMLRVDDRKSMHEWIFEECRDLSEMSFRFKDKERPISYTGHLSGLLHHYPLEDILCGPFVMTEYRPDLVDMILEKLTPEAMRVAVVGKKFEGIVNAKEEWYGTEYKLETISDEQLQVWRDCGTHENLKLPNRNEFIPTNFELVQREETSLAPELLKDDIFSRIWFRQDDKFLLPKACISLEFCSTFGYCSPLHYSMNHLFIQLCNDALNEYTYDAELAGLEYNLDPIVYGMQLTIAGYNDKQHILLKKILEKLTKFEIDPKRFEILKEVYARNLRNINAEQPHQHAVYYTAVIMSEVMWTKEEVLEVLEDVTIEKLKAFIPLLFSRVFIEGLVYGNVSKKQALQLLEMTETILKENIYTKPLPSSQLKRYREIQLPDGCYYIYQKTNDVHRSSCIDAYYQVGMQNTGDNVLLELFCQIIGEPCFNTLRTKEQLGYIVMSGIKRTSGVHGMRIVVQSEKTPGFVEQRIEAFLSSMDEYIQNMSDEEFDKHIAALAAKRLEKPKKMSGQHHRYWSEISSHQYNFDRDTIEVSALKALKKQDLYQFYKDLIAADAPKRHKLSVHVLSTATPSPTGIDNHIPSDGPGNIDAEPVIITDITDFKRDLGLYPLAKPFIDFNKARSKL